MERDLTSTNLMIALSTVVSLEHIAVEHYAVQEKPSVNEIQKVKHFNP
jgi:hypothetical protein